MSNIFETSDFIPVSQTKISIPSSNGLDYNPNQRIEVDIPADIEFINPTETFLECDVNLAFPVNGSGVLTVNPANFTMLPQLLMKDIRVYSGGSGRVLLDEIQNVNVLTNLKYDYDTNENMENKRNITEGIPKYNVEHRGTRGGSKAELNDFTKSVFFDAPDGTLNSSMTNNEFVKAKLLLPIPSGLFKTDRVLMNGMLQGLHLEITLESNSNIIKQLDQVNLNRMIHSGAVFHSTNGSNAAPDTPTSGSNVSHVYIRPENSINNDPLALPFRVGETVEFVNGNTLSSTVQRISSASGGTWEIASIESDTSVSGALVKVTFATARQLSGSNLVPQQSIMISNSVRGVSSYPITYQVTNVNLIVERLQMSGQFKSKMSSMMREGGKFMFDFPTYTNYRISQLASDRVANLRLPLQNSRVRGIACVPTDASVYTQKELITCSNSYIQYLQDNLASAPVRDNKQGYNGIADNITQYQILYDNQLNPSREVKCNKVSAKNSVNAQYIHELENGLVACGIDVLSLNKFRENFVIARQMGGGRTGVVDTRGKDWSLQVEYQESNSPQFAKLWNCFVHHIRRIEFSSNGISLMI
jgi:hypothetical protein